MGHLQQRRGRAAGGPGRLTDARARGARVEAAARDHLVAAGLQALAMNAQARHGELDLVMRDGDTLVFVEVRYRRSDAFGGGFASVDAGKRRRLVLAAQQFLASQREYRDAPCRFDVVDASGDPARPQLRWLRDAFRADDA